MDGRVIHWSPWWRTLDPMLILGIVLLVLALLVPALHVLFWVGIVIIVVGLILILAGGIGHPVGGRRRGTRGAGRGGQGGRLTINSRPEPLLGGHSTQGYYLGEHPGGGIMGGKPSKRHTARWTTGDQEQRVHQ